MKNIGKKGQGAMEYLMNYSWAILIVLVVGMVLYQLGVFNTTSGVPLTPGWAELRPEPHSISYIGTSFSFNILNVLGAPLAIYQVNANETNTGAPCTNVRVNGQDPATSNVTIAKGGALQIQATCPQKAKGDQFNMYIQMHYAVVLDTATSRNVEGYIQYAAE